MIPETKFYTALIVKRKVHYRIPADWADADTCSVEQTEDGARITFPGNQHLIETSRYNGKNRYKVLKLPRGTLTENKYRLENHGEYLILKEDV